MKLINEIIDLLSTDQGKLTEALIKTKVLLHKIGHKELVEWVNNEINGYPDPDKVPSYRILSAQVLVNASNMAYQVTAHPIPLGHLDKKYRERLEQAKIYQSLAIIEKYSELDEGSLQSPIPMEANGLLGKGLSNGYRIQRAWRNIQITDLNQILIQVRSRLLDFLLELSGQFPRDLDEKQIKEQADKIDAENLFNNAIFGDNTTILVGSKNLQTVNNTITKGDFEALSKLLRNNGVEDSDVQSLQTAIKDDESKIDNKEKSFGPSVKT